MILLRHGQSEFNLHYTETKRDPGIADPKLTALGHAQAEAAAEALKSEKITRIIASPYTRTLQSAAPLARALSLPVQIEPLVRERFAFACDIGSPRSALARDWPEHDFAAMPDIWWPAGEESAASVADRAARFRSAIAAHPDWAHTVVVCHWGFILALTGEAIGNGCWRRCDPAASPPADLVWRG
jgi:broad specificity phosphatase PhoE